MKISKVEREGNMGRYFVYDDRGNEIKQVSRDMTAELAEAKRKRWSLERVIARQELATFEVPVKAEVIDVAELPRDDGHYHPLPVHEHDLLEHEHPLEKHDHVVPEHDHRHGHPEADNRIDKIDGEIVTLRAVVAPHEHEMLPHGHGAIESRLHSLEMSAEHQDGHSHPPHEHEDYARKLELAPDYTLQLQTFQQQIAALEARPVDHTHSAIQEMAQEIGNALDMLKRRVEELENQQAEKPVPQGKRYNPLLGHTWHFGGTARPHGKGTLAQYECDCGAKIFAPEGMLLN